MTLAEFFVKIGLDIKQAQFDALEHNLHSLHDGFELLERGVQAVERAFEVFIGSVSEHGAEIAKLSQVMGVSTDIAQQWGYAAQKTGIDLITLERGSERLSANLIAAGNGGKVATEAFAALGIKTHDAHGKLLTTQEAMLAVSDAMAGMSDSGEKTARVQELLGRGGINLLPMLNKGSAAFADMAKEASDLGLILGEDTIKQGAELSREMKTLDSVGEGLKNTIGAGLIPIVLQLVKAFEGWYKRNKDLIKLRIEQVFQILTTAFRILNPLFKVAWWVLTKISDVLGVVIGHASFFAMIMGVVVAQALRAAIAEMLTLDAVAVAAGIESVLAALSMAAAWLAAAAPIVLLGLLLDDLYGFFTGKDSLIGRFIDGWKAKWSELVDKFTEAKPGDPWWLVAIKESLGAAKDLIDVLTGLKGDDTSPPNRIQKMGDYLIDTYRSAADGPAYESRDAERTRLAAEDAENAAMNAKNARYYADQAQSGAYGGFAQQFSQAALQSSAQNVANNSSKSVTSNIHLASGAITINGANGDPKEIGLQVYDAMKSFSDTESRKISAALVQGF